MIYNYLSSARKNEYQVNKIQSRIEYNLLMKKQAESFLKQLHSIPSRTQSPDYHSGNRIKPTASPQQIEYVLREVEKQRTPTRPKHDDKSIEQTTAPRYFQNNRQADRGRNSSAVYGEAGRSAVYGDGAYREGGSRGREYSTQYMDSAWISGRNNEEVVSELKRIIGMMSAQEVSAFDGDAHEYRRQVEQLIEENERLRSQLNNVGDKGGVVEAQNEIKLLKQHLQRSQGELQLRNQQLLKTNKTLSSQVKSLSDRNSLLERQTDELRVQLREKQQQSELHRDQDSRRRNNHQKLSLSMIKQQYGQSIKTLKENIVYDVNDRFNDYENTIKQYKLRLDTLEARLKNAERVNELNRKLTAENQQLKQARPVSYDGRLNQKLSENFVEPAVQDLERENRQLKIKIIDLNRILKEKQAIHESKISELSSQRRQAEDALNETQNKVKQLMQNYQREIKLIRKEAKEAQNSQMEQENRKLRESSEQYWQQIIKMRNQLAKYTSEKAQLEEKVVACENEISRLNHKINNDHLNLVAHTSLLENENSRLKQELQTNYQSQKTTSQAEDEADKLRKQQQLLSELVTKLQSDGRILEDSLRDRENNYNALEAQYNGLHNELNQLKLKSNLTESQIRSTYQNQLNNLQLHNKQLAEKLQQNDLKREELERELQIVRASDIKKDDVICNLEVTIRDLNHVIEDTEGKIDQLARLSDAKSEENKRYEQEVTVLRAELDKALEAIQRQRADYEQLRADAEYQINSLRKELQEKQNVNSQLLTKISTRMSRYRTESLRKQLIELKQLISQGKFDSIEEQLSKLSQSYERQLLRSQQKTLQNDRLAKQNLALGDQLVDANKMKLVLEQKINILASSLKLGEDQVKQLRGRSECLLNDKLLLEKENLMLKKIRLDRQSIEATRARAREISLKIDRLLEMEEKREQQQPAESQISYSQVLTSTIINRNPTG